MTEPLHPPDQPVVLMRDPEAHKKLDALTEKVATVLDWIQGEWRTGELGAAAQLRKHDERLDEQDKRLNRHSDRIKALEDRGTEQIRWGVKTFAEQALRAGAAAAVGAVIVLFAANQQAQPQGVAHAPQSHPQAPDLRTQR